jgi:DNA invertase Pin-like site-specific DNA recombinase
MKIGYARVSTEEQLEDAQLDALASYGCDRIYKERISGKSIQRPELLKMMDVLREGDIVVVQRLDRLGRSLVDLIELLESFKQRNVHFISCWRHIKLTALLAKTEQF